VEFVFYRIVCLWCLIHVGHDMYFPCGNQQYFISFEHLNHVNVKLACSLVHFKPPFQIIFMVDCSSGKCNNKIGIIQLFNLIVKKYIFIIEQHH
jgi:hypothetical protein